jgi:hypothetical protein
MYSGSMTASEPERGNKTRVKSLNVYHSRAVGVVEIFSLVAENEEFRWPAEVIEHEVPLSVSFLHLFKRA